MRFFYAAQVFFLALLAALMVFGLAPATVQAQSQAANQANKTPDSPLALPVLRSRVTDLTGTLNEEQIAQLNNRLSAIEQAKGTQVAVLLAPTFRPESIEQYGIRLAEAWKIGRKGVDDGVILLIAKEDRQLRIEVGYGLEGALTDATAKRIISEVITPHLRREDFFGGIDAGIAAIQTIINGESLPPSSNASAVTGARMAEGNLLPLLGMAAFFAPMLNRLLGLSGSFLAGGIAVLVGGFLLGSWVAGVFLGIFVLLFSFMRGGTGLGGGMGGRGGFGGGGGGFSGGGGGFGGGGASGRW
ncbi:MAG: TPM domain-containing protein [Rhodocyclales bacterium]|nr:TPM domain-containing protein [Rhodocyclales bacterium]